jgi:hypothetical protein
MEKVATGRGLLKGRRRPIWRHLINLLICHVAAMILCVILDNDLGPTLQDKVTVFFYFAISGVFVIFLAAIVYAVFFLSARYILRKIRREVLGVAVYILYGCLYSGVVLWIEWRFSGDEYASFQEFLRGGVNYLAMFLLVIVVELGVLMTLRPGVWVFNNN